MKGRNDLLCQHARGLEINLECNNCQPKDKEYGRTGVQILVTHIVFISDESKLELKDLARDLFCSV